MILKSPLPAFNDNTLPSDAESIITYGGLSDGLVLSSEDLMLILFLSDILCPQRAVPRPSTKHVTLSLCPSMLMFTGISVVYVYPSLLTYQSVSDANRSVTNTGDINCPKNLRSESFILTIFFASFCGNKYTTYSQKKQRVFACKDEKSRFTALFQAEKRLRIPQIAGKMTLGHL